MRDQQTIEELDRASLIKLVLALREQNQQLQEQLDRLLKSGSRQQRRSSGGRSSPPKRPGRRSGEGTFRHRDAPDPQSYTSLEQVEIDQQSCPRCQGVLVADGYETVTMTDLPKQLTPEIRAWRLALCRCNACGRRVRAEHPEVAADQRGATAHRLGERVQAFACWLHYAVGVPQRKVPEIVRQVSGISLTQGALTQAAERYAEGQLQQSYGGLRQEIADAAVVHTDDTGWRIAGNTSYLMGFSSGQTLYYQIRDRHRHQEVSEVIGEAFGGVLVTDRFSSYNALSAVLQQKCLAHIQRNVKDHLIAQPLRARAFPRRLLVFFKEAQSLRNRRDQGEISDQEYGRRVVELAERLDRLLAPRRLQNEENQKLLDGLGWHHARGSLLRFLRDRGVPTTNNEAERMLRPAVIARKVSHCSSSARGALTRSVMVSLFGTLRRRLQDASEVLEWFVRLLNGEPMPRLA